MDDLNGLVVCCCEGSGFIVVFLFGYVFDMVGLKVVVFDVWVIEIGCVFVWFDYCGCGESVGVFEDFMLVDWCDDVLSVIDSVEGLVMLVGLLMGGWIMLLVVFV